MSKWNDFKKSIGTLADKTANKTRELTDTAALKIKIANKEADRDTEYKNLGKLAYTKLKDLEGTDKDELTRAISDSMEKLDLINRELAELRAEEEARRAQKEAEKQAKEAEKAKKEADDEQLDMGVMEEFNEARKEADAAYEEAKQAADEAKAESDDIKAQPDAEN